MIEQKIPYRLPLLCISCYAVCLIDGTVAAAYLKVVVMMAVVPDERAVVNEFELLQRGRALCSDRAETFSACMLRTIVRRTRATMVLDLHRRIRLFLGGGQLQR